MTGNKHAVRKTVVTVAALGVVGVVIVALVFSRDLRVAYHLHRLRSDPSLLRELVRANDGSAPRLAVTRYVASDDGRQKLFELYLSLFLEEWVGPKGEYLGPAAAPPGARAVTVDDFQEAGFASTGERLKYRLTWTGRGGTNGEETLSDRHNREVLRALTPLFPVLSSRSFAHTQYPNHEFRFTTANELGNAVGLFFTAAEHQTGAFLLVEKAGGGDG